MNENVKQCLFLQKFSRFYHAVQPCENILLLVINFAKLLLEFCINTMPISAKPLVTYKSVNQTPSRSVVLKLFCMFYPFNKDDYQIYPQYIKWCSFIKKTKETIYISYN